MKKKRVRAVEFGVGQEGGGQLASDGEAIGELVGDVEAEVDEREVQGSGNGEGAFQAGGGGGRQVFTNGRRGGGIARRPALSSTAR